ncbi:MAG TPA: hypothetical protein VMT89_03210 [Candidatus Acidoferrales bacterium]|nr:hypothetical protein [Candidatus Acidoferrales bacterium]
MRRGATPSAQPENVEATIAKLIAGGAIIDPAAAALQPATDLPTAVPSVSANPAAQQMMDNLVARVQGLERELAKAQEEIEAGGRRIRQLTMSNNALGRERDGLSQRLADIESGHGSELTELRAELTAAQERMLAVESERARIHRLSEGRHQAAQQSISSLEKERDTLQTRAQGAEANVAELQTLLAAVFDERDRLTAQVETLSVDLRGAQEAFQRNHSEATQERAALEADRDGWKEEAEAVRAQLTQRAEQLALTERELRSTTVARDALAEQLAAARAESERLTLLGDELAQSTSQLEAARAATAAENAALRRSSDEERATRIETENNLRAELTAAQANVERLTTGADALRGELSERIRVLAERDEQLAELHAARDAARQSESALQENLNLLRAEATTLQARLEQATAERQQLLEERATLRSSLAEARQRGTQTEVANAATIGQLQAEVAELQRQTQSLSNDRAGLIERLKRSTEEGRDLTRRLAETQRHADELTESLRSRDTALADGSSERERLSSQLVALTGELRTAQETLERNAARAAQERSTFDAQRAGWEEQLEAAQAELTHRTEAVVGLERELRSTVVARDAALTELQATQEDHQRLTALADQLRQELTQAEADRDASGAGHSALRRTLEGERAARAEAERGLRTDVTLARTDVERLNAAVTVLRNDLDDRTRMLGERDDQISALQREIEALRQESADRGVLAQQATELGHQVVEIEQQLAAVRGDAARAERQSAAIAEELAAVRRQQSEAAAAMARERDAWQLQEQQLLDEQRRVDGEASTLRGELEATRAAHVQLQTALEQAHSDRARALENEQHAARLLEDLNGTLQQRDAALAAATQSRAQLGEQLQQVKRELRDTQAALDQQRIDTAAAHGAETEQLATQLQSALAQAREIEQKREAVQAKLQEVQERAQISESTHLATIEKLEATAAALRSQLSDLTSARDELGERLQKAEQTANDRAGAAEEEGRRAAALSERLAQLEAAAQASEARRNAVSQELAQARSEIEELRQQSADRGVLAHQASDLGTRVVELEQQLAAVRGEAAQAERQRAVVAEELEAARRLQAQNEVVGDRKLAQLRDAVDRLTEERRRVDALYTERSAEVEAQRATLAELQASLEQIRSERADAEARGHDLSQQLGEAHRRLEEVSSQMRQREGTIDAASADRSRLSAQATKLASQLRASQEAFEALQGRTALERAAAEAERDRWREQANATRIELETLLASTDAVSEDASQAAAARAAAVAQMEALQHALEVERSGRKEIEGTLRGELETLRQSFEQLSGDNTTLRNQLLDREAQFAALTVEHEDAVQAQASSQQASVAARSELAAIAARLAETTAELDALRAERERVESELNEVAGARGEEAQALAQQLQSTRTQLRALEHEKAMAQAALNEHQQRTRDLAEAHASAVGQMQTAAEDLRKQIAELNAGRQQLSERLDRAEQELRSRASREESALLEQGALSERCQVLEQQLMAAENRRASTDAELAQARAEIDSWRARQAESGAIADHAGELGKRIAEMEQQLAAARGESTRAERQRAALTEELQAAHAQRDEAARIAESEQARLRDKLQQFTDERKRIEALQAQQQNELESHRGTLDELRTELERLRAERLHLEQEGQDVGQSLSEAQRRIEELTAQLQQRDSAIEAAAGERRRLEEAVRAAEQAAQMLTTERDVELASDLVLHVREERRTTASAGPDVGSEAVLVIERSAPLSEALDAVALDAVAESGDAAPAALEEPSQAQVTAEPVRELVLLDSGKRGDEASAALRSAGFEATLAPPVEKTVEDLVQRTIGCVMINLAAGPQAWRTLKALREAEATSSVPILAYLMPPEGQKGFCFGRADFGFWPMNPDELVSRLDRLCPKLKRLLAVSADIDGMGKVRDPLAKANVSTSIVLDGKQALEYTTIVAPEAAVLHLSPTTTAIARAVAGIRGQEPTAALPMLLLLDKAPAREEAFFASAVRELLIKGTFQFSRLPAEIARILA